MVSCRSHTRNARGDRTPFFINLVDKHLDRVGGRGDPKLFHRITFPGVTKFVKFDLDANDILLPGSTLMQQLHAVAGQHLLCTACKSWPSNFKPSTLSRKRMGCAGQWRRCSWVCGGRAYGLTIWLYLCSHSTQIFVIGQKESSVMQFAKFFHGFRAGIPQYGVQSRISPGGCRNKVEDDASKHAR